MESVETMAALFRLKNLFVLSFLIPLWIYEVGANMQKKNGTFNVDINVDMSSDCFDLEYDLTALDFMMSPLNQAVLSEEKFSWVRLRKIYSHIMDLKMHLEKKASDKLGLYPQRPRGRMLRDRPLEDQTKMHILLVDLSQLYRRLYVSVNRIKSRKGRLDHLMKRNLIKEIHGIMSSAKRSVHDTRGMIRGTHGHLHTMYEDRVRCYKAYGNYSCPIPHIKQDYIQILTWAWQHARMDKTYQNAQETFYRVIEMARRQRDHEITVVTTHQDFLLHKALVRIHEHHRRVRRINRKHKHLATLINRLHDRRRIIKRSYALLSKVFDDHQYLRNTTRHAHIGIQYGKAAIKRIYGPIIDRLRQLRPQLHNMRWRYLEDKKRYRYEMLDRIERHKAYLVDDQYYKSLPLNRPLMKASPYVELLQSQERISDLILKIDDDIRTTKNYTDQFVSIVNGLAVQASSGQMPKSTPKSNLPEDVEWSGENEPQNDGWWDWLDESDETEPTSTTKQSTDDIGNDRLVETPTKTISTPSDPTSSASTTTSFMDNVSEAVKTALPSTSQPSSTTSIPSTSESSTAVPTTEITTVSVPLSTTSEPQSSTTTSQAAIDSTVSTDSAPSSEPTAVTTEEIEPDKPVTIMTEVCYWYGCRWESVVVTPTSQPSSTSSTEPSSTETSTLEHSTKIPTITVPVSVSTTSKPGTSPTTSQAAMDSTVLSTDSAPSSEPTAVTTEKIDPDKPVTIRTKVCNFWGICRWENVVVTPTLQPSSTSSTKPSSTETSSTETSSTDTSTLESSTKDPSITVPVPVPTTSEPKTSTTSQTAIDSTVLSTESTVTTEEIDPDKPVTIMNKVCNFWGICRWESVVVTPTSEQPLSPTTGTPPTVSSTVETENDYSSEPTGSSPISTSPMPEVSTTISTKVKESGEDDTDLKGADCEEGIEGSGEVDPLLCPPKMKGPLDASQYLNKLIYSSQGRGFKLKFDAQYIKKKLYQVRNRYTKAQHRLHRQFSDFPQNEGTLVKEVLTETRIKLNEKKLNNFNFKIGFISDKSNKLQDSIMSFEKKLNETRTTLADIEHSRKTSDPPREKLKDTRKYLRKIVDLDLDIGVKLRDIDHLRESIDWYIKSLKRGTEYAKEIERSFFPVVPLNDQTPLLGELPPSLRQPKTVKQFGFSVKTNSVTGSLFKLESSEDRMLNDNQIDVGMRDGKPCVEWSVKSTKKTLTCPHTINDGIWHHVKLTKSGSELVFSEHSLEDPTKMRRQSVTLPIDSIFAPFAKNIHLSAQRPPQNRYRRDVDNYIDSNFTACLTNFVMDGHLLGLETNASFPGIQACPPLLPEAIANDSTSIAKENEVIADRDCIPRRKTIQNIAVTNTNITMISVSFITKDKRGALLVYRTSSGDIWVLRFFRGYLMFEGTIGRERFRKICYQTITSGHRWHLFVITMNEFTSLLYIDGEVCLETRMRLLPVPPGNDVSLTIYASRHDLKEVALKFLPSRTHIRRYRGRLRHLIVNNKKLPINQEESCHKNSRPTRNIQ